MKDNSYKEERIQRLLSMAFGARKSELALSYAVQVLDIDPDVPEALMIKADHTENAEERLEHLQHALNVADNKKNINERKLMIYALKQRTAYTLFTLKRYEEAYKITDSVVNGVIDPYVAEFYEDSTDVADLNYRLLIHFQKWREILSTAMKDPDNTLAKAYSKMMATFMLSQDGDRSVCARMFWDTLVLGTDVPFYMLGYKEEPDYDAPMSLERQFDFSLMFFDTLQISVQFFRWYSRGALLFGLLSNRVVDDFEAMINVLKSLGGFEEYEAMSKIILECDDRAIIEMLAAHKCLSK